MQLKAETWRSWRKVLGGLGDEIDALTLENVERVVAYPEGACPNAAQEAL
jgi:hypothetical protein